MASVKDVNSSENDVNILDDNKRKLQMILIFFIKKQTLLVDSTKLQMLQSEDEIKSKGADYFIQDIDDFRKNLLLIKF